MINNESNVLDPIVTDYKERNVWNQPHNLFLAMAILLLIINYFVWGESVVLLSGTPLLSISCELLLYFTAAMLFIGWLIYKVTFRLLSSITLSWIHIGITLLMTCYFLITETWFLKSDASSDVQAGIIQQLMIKRTRMINLNSLPCAIFLLAQIFYIANLIVGMKMKKKLVKTN